MSSTKKFTSGGEYKFREYDNISNKPVDVYYKTIYLGTIQVTGDGQNYEVKIIKHPNTGMNIHVNADSNKNKFKTKMEAANMLHKIWKYIKGGNYLT